MPSDQEIQQRIENLAQNMLQKRLAFSMSQARERARDVVLQEIKAQEQFEKMKDDPALNPQQRKMHVDPNTLKGSGGMLTGNELPKDVPLSELLKGRREKK